MVHYKNSGKFVDITLSGIILQHNDLDKLLSYYYFNTKSGIRIHMNKLIFLNRESAKKIIFWKDMFETSKRDFFINDINHYLKNIMDLFTGRRIIDDTK